MYSLIVLRSVPAPVGRSSRPARYRRRVAVRPLEPDDAPTCDAIVASLPEWFGVAEGIRQAAESVRHDEGFVVDTADGVVGFLTLHGPHPGAAEISWMAVHHDHRSSGVGSELLERAERELRGNGVRLLVVKTLSDRLDPGPQYAQTRAFYLARGFIPILELDIWGPENPCQVLAKPL